jgi:hypothetical protein
MNLPMLALGAMLAPLAAGCSSSAAMPEVPFDGSFPEAPYLTLPSTSAALSVQLRTWPQPPAQGLGNAEYTVTQADGGAPVDGLSVSIRPWMPAMEHGPIRPTVTGEDAGRYLITNLDLYMAGEWQLQTSFSGPIEDHVTPEFEVP